MIFLFRRKYDVKAVSCKVQVPLLHVSVIKRPSGCFIGPNLALGAI